MFRNLKPVLAALALLLATAGSPAPSIAAEDSTYEFIREYFEQCLNQPGDYRCLEKFWASGGISVQEGEELRRSLFPDLSYELVEVLVDGDRVAVRCRVTGHAVGTAPATEAGDGRRLEIDEAFFYQLKDGKIVSGKPFSDRWEVARILGYTITPPEATP